MSVKVYGVQEQMAAMVTGLFVAKLLMINEGHKWNEAQKRVHKSPSHANSNNSNRTTQEDIVLLFSLGSISTEAFGKIIDIQITLVITQEIILSRPPRKKFNKKGPNEEREDRNMFQHGVQHIQLHFVIAFERGCWVGNVMNRCNREIPSTESGLLSYQVVKEHSVEIKVNVSRLVLIMSHDFLRIRKLPHAHVTLKHTGYSFRVLLGRIHIVLSLPLGKSSSHLYIFLKLCELTLIQYAADSGAYAAKSSV